jgi:hypothetical protein
MSGGKDPWASLPWHLVQAAEALMEEALAPLAHDLAGSIEAMGDLIVAQALGGIEHDLGTDHVSIR